MDTFMSITLLYENEWLEDTHPLMCGGKATEALTLPSLKDFSVQV